MIFFESIPHFEEPYMYICINIILSLYIGNIFIYRPLNYHCDVSVTRHTSISKFIRKLPMTYMILIVEASNGYSNKGKLPKGYWNIRFDKVKYLP